MSTIGKKSFNIINRISKSFSVYIRDFQYATSLFFKAGFKIPITFLNKVIMKPSLTLTLKKVRLITATKVRVAITQVFSLKKVNIIATLRERVYAQTIIGKKLLITFASKSRQRVTVALRVSKISLILDPTVARFNLLSLFDPQGLSALDTLTLEEMDFTET